MPLTQLLASFQSLPPLPTSIPTSKLGPSGANSLVGGFLYVLGPCGSLQQTNSPVSMGVPPPAATPTGFSVRGFEALFPHTGSLCLCGLSQSAVVPFVLSTCKCGTSHSASCYLARSSRCCLALPGPPAAALSRVLSTLAACLCPSYQSG